MPRYDVYPTVQYVPWYHGTMVVSCRTPIPLPRGRGGRAVGCAQAGTSWQAARVAIFRKDATRKRAARCHTSFTSTHALFCAIAADTSAAGAFTPTLLQPAVHKTRYHNHSH